MPCSGATTDTPWGSNAPYLSAGKISIHFDFGTYTLTQNVHVINNSGHCNSNTDLMHRLISSEYKKEYLKDFKLEKICARSLDPTNI